MAASAGPGPSPSPDRRFTSGTPSARAELAPDIAEVAPDVAEVAPDIAEVISPGTGRLARDDAYAVGVCIGWCAIPIGLRGTAILPHISPRSAYVEPIGR